MRKNIIYCSKEGRHRTSDYDHILWVRFQLIDPGQRLQKINPHFVLTGSTHFSVVRRMIPFRVTINLGSPTLHHRLSAINARIRYKIHKTITGKLKKKLKRAIAKRRKIK